MEEKFNALCIRAVPYKDSDIMLTLFTLEKGLISCIVRGVKKQGAKLKFCTQLFCFAEYVVAEKSSRRTVIEASEIDSFYGIATDVDRYYSALGVIEFIRGVLQDEILAYDLFLLTIKTLKSIKETDQNPYVFLAKFLTEAIDLSGYGIDFVKCGKCFKQISERVFFNFDDCVFECIDCANAFSVEMRFATYCFLQRLSKLSIDQLKSGEFIRSMGDKTLKANCFNALKFLDFYIRDKIGLNIKTNQTIIELLNQ